MKCHGKPTVILAKTIKGYGLGEVGRGPQRHPPAEEAQRGGAAGVPHALRHPDLRRRGRQGAVLPAAGGSRGDAVPARAARRPSAARADAGRKQSPLLKTPSLADYSRVHREERRPRGLDDHRRGHADGVAAQGQARSASSSCRSCPTRRAPSAWSRSSSSAASTPTPGSSTSRSIPTSCSTTARRRTARSSRRASPRRAACRRFIAAGTAYATHGVPMIPFFIYYSMFGFQRIGDLIWAAGDCRARGFLLGGTAGPHHARRRGAAAPGRPQPPVRDRLSRP